MKAILTLVLSLAAAIAHADVPKVNSIACLDNAQNHKAPVYVDIAADHPSSPTGLGLIVGNIVDFGPDAHGKSSTVLGHVEKIVFQGQMVHIKGSFGTELTVNRLTGAGFLTSLIKYDPVTGKYVGTIQLEKFPLACTMN